MLLLFYKPETAALNITQSYESGHKILFRCMNFKEFNVSYDKKRKEKKSTGFSFINANIVIPDF